MLELGATTGTPFPHSIKDCVFIDVVTIFRVAIDAFSKADRVERYLTSGVNKRSDAYGSNLGHTPSVMKRNFSPFVTAWWRTLGLSGNRYSLLIML